ncbi:uncharacterized protein LOC144919022 isoform X1 [Branchiostoma floridae x Branchiostoma belcheri]
MVRSPSFVLLFSCFAVSSASINLDLGGQYSCTFDFTICGWSLEGAIFHGAPAECDYGWPVAARPGVTIGGEYVCFNLEEQHSSGTNRSRLISPTINTTHPVVLSFYVGTVRPPNSTYLNVFVMNMDGTESLLWSTSDLLFPWQRVQVGVGQTGMYKVVIDGVPDPPSFPKFGIDQITLTAVLYLNTTTAEPFTDIVTTVGSQNNITFPTAQNPTFKTTTKLSVPPKTPSMTSKLTPTKSVQLGNSGTTGADPLPIALGIVGGLLVVAIVAFAVWKLYPRKAIVSPGQSAQEHDQLP